MLALVTISAFSNELSKLAGTLGKHFARAPQPAQIPSQYVPSPTGGFAGAIAGPKLKTVKGIREAAPSHPGSK